MKRRNSDRPWCLSAEKQRAARAALSGDDLLLPEQKKALGLLSKRANSASFVGGVLSGTMLLLIQELGAHQAQQIVDGAFNVAMFSAHGPARPWAKIQKAARDRVARTKGKTK